jgi:hypothetical protein
VRFSSLSALAFAVIAFTLQKDMTRDQIQTAIDEGIPFLIKMADGEKYEVTESYRVALGRTTVVVIGEDDVAHILPLLTMTGISYMKSKKKS